MYRINRSHRPIRFRSNYRGAADTTHCRSDKHTNNRGPSTEQTLKHTYIHAVAAVIAISYFRNRLLDVLPRVEKAIRPKKKSHKLVLSDSY